MTFRDESNRLYRRLALLACLIGIAYLALRVADFHLFYGFMLVGRSGRPGPGADPGSGPDA